MDTVEKIQPLTVGALRNMEFPPENYIVSDGLLGKTGIMMIGGPPKSYKSFLAQEIMLDLATGKNLFGVTRSHAGKTEEKFKVVRPQKVLFLEQEIGLYDVRERILPALLTFTPEEQALIDANMFVVSQDHTMRLDKDDGIKRIVEIIKQVGPDVVCFDPLIEFHTSDESNAQEMAKVMWNISMMRNMCEFATIITHHTSKPNQNKREGPDKLRGSSVIFGKGDSFLMLDPGNRNHRRIKVDFTIRRGVPLDPIYVKLDKETHRFSFAGFKDDK